MMKASRQEVRVIYINGPSSSGKTSLAKVLQEELDTFFLHISIDKMIGMMPAKTNAWERGPAPMGFSWKTFFLEDGTKLYALQSGPFAKKITTTFRHLVKTLLEQGHFVIIDDICFCSEEQEAWIKELSTVCHPSQILWIELYTHLEILQQREHKRGNRIAGSSQAQALGFAKGKKILKGIFF
jgi:chloramphenicol 3-O phosphotransferase